MRHTCSIATLALGLVVALLGSAARATPTLTASADHTAIDASGTGYSTSGRTVEVDAYGLSGTSKTFIAKADATPLQKSNPIPPCLFGDLCKAGSFMAPHMYQKQDPCYGGGFSQIRVVAYTEGPKGKRYKVATAQTTVTCSVTQKPARAGRR